MVTYNVSGEYAMVKAAALMAGLTKKQMVMEMLIGMNELEVT